jgi:hypothetical protein
MRFLGLEKKAAAEAPNLNAALDGAKLWPVRMRHRRKTYPSPGRALQENLPDFWRF